MFNSKIRKKVEILIFVKKKNLI